MKLYVNAIVFLIYFHSIVAENNSKPIRSPKVEPNVQFNFKTVSGVNNAVVASLQHLPHIAAGAEAARYSFPYVVFVKTYQESENHSPVILSCAGSVISPQWVLTAAHCLERLRIMYAYAGVHDIRINEPTQQTVLVEKSIKHPNWESKSGKHDLALLKLKSNLNLDGFVKTIRLPAWSEKDSWFWRSSVKTAGWGTPSEGLSFLLTSNSTVVTNWYCSWWYGFERIKDYHICTDDPQSNFFDKGPGGGPLVIIDSDGQPTLIGVATNNFENGFEKSYPTVFTRVTHYLEWITNTTGIIIRKYKS